MGDRAVHPARSLRSRVAGARWLSLALASACALCLAAPFVLGLVALLVEVAAPVRLGGDSALIELATREASAGARLLGPYSRFGWNHPGPLYFYLLALPYRAAAGAPRGLYAGVLGLNLGAAMAVIAVVWRRSGPRAVPAATAIVLALALALTPAWLRDLWNPTVIVLPTLLFLVLCAATAAGSGASLVGAVVVGSFLAQTHVAVAPFVALLLAAACAGRALGAVPGAAWPRGLRWLRPGALRTGLIAAGMGLAALAWAPPLADQLAAAGNLAALARFFLGGGAGHGAAEGWQAFLHGAGTLPFGLPPQRPGPVAPGAKLAVVALAMLVSAAAVVVGSRRGERFAAWLGAFSLLGGIVAVGLATRISGAILGYLLFWMAAVPVAGLLGGAVLAARSLRWKRWRHAAAAGPTLAAVALAAVLARAMVGLPPLAANSDPAVVGALDLVEGAGGSDRVRRVHVALADHRQWPVAAGVVNGLVDLGYDVTVPAKYLPMYGQRYAPADRPDLVVVLGDRTRGAPPGARSLGTVGDTAVFARRPAGQVVLSFRPR